MQTAYTEQSYENSVIELFYNMGYTHIYGPDIKNRNFYSPLHEDVMHDCIFRLNSGKSKVAIEENEEIATSWINSKLSKIGIKV